MSQSKIIRTDCDAQYDWPAGTFLQGGTRGVVFGGEGGPYRTAFVEAFPRQPPTFLRGEGPTVPEAETAAWQQWQHIAACPAHPEHGPFEAREYTNGCGFCAQCGAWVSGVLPEHPEAFDRPVPLVERAFTEPAVALGVIATVAAADQLPSKPAAAGQTPT